MCLFKLIISSNIKAFYFKKIWLKCKYLIKTITFLVSIKTIYVFLAKYINIELKLREIINIIKVLIFLSNVVLANLILSMISIFLIVNKALAAI